MSRAFAGTTDALYSTRSVIDYYERVWHARYGIGLIAVDVAISVDRDGNLNVSIFDWNDPEHVMKLRRYLSRKEEDGDTDGLVYQQLVGHPRGEIPQEQILLILGCFMLIAVYVFVKLLFSSEGTGSHNEL
jgi:hypothetical protein